MVILCSAKRFEVYMEVHPNAGFVGRMRSEVGSCGVVWNPIHAPGKQVAVNFHQIYP